jgi:predicted Zn finger-like uncharacterized protein
MFTQCPDCRKVFSVTAEQLHANALVFCSDCNKEFSGYELLSEKPVGLVDQASIAIVAKPNPRPKAKAKKKARNRQQNQQNTGVDLDTSREGNVLELQNEISKESVLAAKVEFIEKIKPKPKYRHKNLKNREQVDKALPIDIGGWDIKGLGLSNEKTPGLIAEAKSEFIPKAELGKKSRFNISYKNWLRSIKNPDGKSQQNSQNETLSSIAKPPVITERLPWEIAETPVNANWILGLIVGCVLFLGQFLYFESSAWGQNIVYRPHLEKICRWLGCQLRDYQNLDELNVLSSSFVTKANNTIEIKAVINNQADFAQHLPNIYLTLLDFNEQPFAQRIFTPKEYLSISGKGFSLAPDTTLEISLTIAAPKISVGGHTIDLTYIK